MATVLHTIVFGFTRLIILSSHLLSKKLWSGALKNARRVINGGLSSMWIFFIQHSILEQTTDTVKYINTQKKKKNVR